jgi:hypothetical protein
MADSLSFDLRLDASGDGPVVLPSNETAANAQFSREGADLYLREPDGHAIKVAGYFSHDNPPDLVSADGARLSHSMVDSFLMPAHPVQVAANATASDASPVGKVTEVLGDATITRTDGTHAKIDAGMAVHMGDIIETSAKGAVHILFADDTTFAISHSARLAIDNYTYDPQTHTGTSFFSMLHGVFVYTSGLIGKTDPGDVNIHTPVGSIGIRGTVIAGDINTAGQPSTVTVVDGAIVVSNDGGTLTMNSSLDTATLTNYSTAPSDSGVMSTQSFDTTYSAVAPVDPAFSSLTSGVTSAPATTTAPAPTTTAPDTTTSPTTTAPDTMTQATPGDTVGTTVTVTGTTTVNVSDPYDPTVTDPTVALTSSTVTSPTSATTFSSDTTTFGTTATGTTSFTGTTATFGGAPATDGSLTTSTGGTTTTSTSSSTSSSTSFTTTNPTLGSTTTGSTTGGTVTVSVPPPTAAHFLFGSAYTFSTTTTTDDGIPLFGDAAAFSTVPGSWPGTITLGTISTTGMTSPTFSLSGSTGTTLVPHTGGGGGYDLVGTTITPTTGGSFNTGTGTIAHFDISSAGTVTMSVANPLGLENLTGLQTTGFNFTATATDSLTGTPISSSFSLQFQPLSLPGPVHLVLGNETPGTPDTGFSLPASGTNLIFEGAGTLGNLGAFTPQVVGAASTEHDIILLGTGGSNYVIWGGQGTVNIYGSGESGDVVQMANNSFLNASNTSTVNGGTGGGFTLEVGSSLFPSQDFNFTGHTNVTNIATLMSVGPTGSTNTIELSMQDVFDMTSANSNHTLTVENQPGFAIGTNLTVDTQGGTVFQTGTSSDTVAGSLETITGKLVSNGQSVTLIIDHGAGLPTNGVAVTLH